MSIGSVIVASDVYHPRRSEIELMVLKLFTEQLEVQVLAHGRVQIHV